MSELVEDIRKLVIESWKTLPMNKFGEFANIPSGFTGREEFYELVNLMEIVSRNYLVPYCSKFLDFGSGDGTIVFLARSYDFDSYGLEIDSERVDISGKYQKRLNLTEKVHLIEGDWKKQESYDKLGISLSRVDFFYIYPSANGLQAAFNIVSKEAKKDAILTVMESSENEMAKLPQNLIFVERIYHYPASPINIYRKG